MFGNGVTGRVVDVSSKPSLQQASRVTLLLIDSSGSMSSNDPNRKRVEAAEQIVDLAGANDYIIVGTFGDNTTPPFLKVTGVAQGHQKTELKSYIRQVGQSGNHTPIYQALSEGIMAMSELGEQIQQAAGRSISGFVEFQIIMLTDGDYQFSPGEMDSDDLVIYRDLLGNPEFVVLAAQQTAIRLYTIGLSNANTEQLKMLAERTDGSFGETRSAEGLSTVFAQFGRSMQGRTVLTVRLDGSDASRVNDNTPVYVSVEGCQERIRGTLSPVAYK